MEDKSNIISEMVAQITAQQKSIMNMLLEVLGKDKEAINRAIQKIWAALNKEERKGFFYAVSANNRLQSLLNTDTINMLNPNRKTGADRVRVA